MLPHKGTIRDGQVSTTQMLKHQIWMYLCTQGGNGNLYRVCAQCPAWGHCMRSDCVRTPLKGSCAEAPNYKTQRDEETMLRRQVKQLPMEAEY